MRFWAWRFIMILTSFAAMPRHVLLAATSTPRMPYAFITPSPQVHAHMLQGFTPRNPRGLAGLVSVSAAHSRMFGSTRGIGYRAQGLRRVRCPEFALRIGSGAEHEDTSHFFSTHTTPNRPAGEHLINVRGFAWCKARDLHLREPRSRLH